MRVYNLKQMLGQNRILQIQLQLHAGRHKGKALHQPLDIGVANFDPVHAQTCGNFRIAFGELFAHFSERKAKGEIVLLIPPLPKGAN